MFVLVLSPYPAEIVETLKKSGDEFRIHNERIDLPFLETTKPDLVVSYGYRYILSRDVVEAYPSQIINLHISYLPYGRGADPNFWSWIEGTPKGVTLHLIDEGIDTGDILAQRETVFDGTETLSSSYDKLHADMVSLFVEAWPAIREGRITPRKQEGRGTYHRSADKMPIFGTLLDGYATPVRVLERIGQSLGARRASARS
jgi:methionyl-tRNA formyltransferase